jgi:hypothetical protein
MAQIVSIDDESESLYYFQLRDLFEVDELDNFLIQPHLEGQYPDIIRRWKSPDMLTRERVLIPGNMVHAIAQKCRCVGDFFADPDGQTLHIVNRGEQPFRFWTNEEGKIVVEDIANTIKLTPDQAIREFGAHAAWIAQEYGKSRRGDRDNRYRNNIEIS